MLSATLAALWSDLPARLLLLVGLAGCVLLSLAVPFLPDAPLVLLAVAWLAFLVNALVGAFAFAQPDWALAAYGLWGGALFVQALVWVAALA